MLLILSILEARAEILTKKVPFLGDLKTPKFPYEILVVPVSHRKLKISFWDAFILDDAAKDPLLKA